MAGTRTITSLITRANGAPWPNARVTFRLRDDTFTVAPDASYPISLVEAITGGDGALAVTLASGLSAPYEVTMPDGETFFIYVPDGPGAATIEGLRAAFIGFTPEGAPDLAGAVESALAQPSVQGIISHLNINDRGSTTHAGIDTHIASSSGVHGVTGDVVGTSGAQTLANKTLGAGTKVALGGDAAGDLYRRGAGGVLARLPLGAAGQGLKVNATGSDVEWGAVGGGGGASTLDDLTDVTITAPAVGDVVKFDGSAWVNLPDAGGAGGGSGTGVITGSLIFQLGDPAGAVIATGTKGYLRVPFACTLTAWHLGADAATTTTLDVWKDIDANYPPTDGDRIAGTEKPALAATSRSADTGLTTWTTAVAAGDWIGVEVEANSAAKYLALMLDFERTIVSQYTDEDAQDAIAALMMNSASIAWTYTDALPTLVAEVVFAGTGLASTAARSDHGHDLDYAPLGHAHTSADVSDFTEAAQDAVGTIVADTATINATYDDVTPALTLDVLDNSSTQRVRVGKAGTLAGTRREINFIDGANVTMTVADDAANDRVNVTIASVGGGGGGGTLAIENADSAIGNATTLDFTAGFAVTDEGAGEINIAPNFGATAGSIAEGNHTHTSAGITDFTEAAQDAVGAILTDSASVDLAYSDALGQITAAVIFPASGAGTNGTAGIAARADHSHDATALNGFAEGVRDVVGITLVAGTGITKTVDDALDITTLAADIGAGATQVAAGNHAHSLTSANITDFNEATDDRVAALITAAAPFTKSYNDAAGVLTLGVTLGTGATDAAAGNHGHTLVGEAVFAIGDPGGGVIPTGTKGYLSIPFACTITGWRLIADTAATVTADVWKIGSGVTLPTNANSITASAKPGLSAATVARSTTLTGWTTSVIALDMLGIEIEANDTAKYLMLAIEYMRTI